MGKITKQRESTDDEAEDDGGFEIVRVPSPRTGRGRPSLPASEKRRHPLPGKFTDREFENLWSRWDREGAVGTFASWCRERLLGR